MMSIRMLSKQSGARSELLGLRWRIAKGRVANGRRIYGEEDARRLPSSATRASWI
jgi:hypothetical protein